MGCSLGAQMAPDSNVSLNAYFVRAPLPSSPEKIPVCGGDSRKHTCNRRNAIPRIQKNQRKEPQRKWIRNISIMDMRCSLTTRDKFQIIKSWKGIARDLGITGLNMFIRYIRHLVFI